MFSRFDISILAPGMPFDAETLDTKSLGGSESAAIYMARALSKEGARVNLFCGTQRASEDNAGVRYLPARAWPDFAKVTPHDVCIVQRAPEALAHRTNARLNLLWCHDLALGRQERAVRAVMWNIDRVIVLSRFMAEQYKEVYRLDEETMVLSRNGVDLELFDRLRRADITRDRTKLIYAARPERGLDVLLRDVMPRLLARKPDLRLYLAGYDNRPPDWQSFYAECDALAARFGDRVVRLGCLTKRELYEHYLSAGVYVYPTPSPALPNFREISCISAMECQAAGLPIVTSSVGALAETIAPGAGALIERDGDLVPSEKYAERFAEEVLRLVDDDAAWTSASDCGLARARDLDWSGVANQWLAEFERLIRSHNDSPERLLRHLWRTSDIVAAKEVVRRSKTAASVESRAVADLGAELLLPWSFMDDPDGYRKQYETIGSGHNECVYDTAPKEPRFVHLEQWLRERVQEVCTVLDYGCAHGAYAIGLAQRLEHLKIHGLDIDHFSVDMAAAWASKRGLADRATFSVLGPDATRQKTVGRRHGFDCALLQEVLEHVPEPWRILESVERSVRLGGRVYITVPFGPWEFTSYRTYPHRCHIWHFDEHDLRDMVGSKPDLTIDVMYAGDNPLSGEPQGWWIVTYAADHHPVGPIDLERHLWLQRPRQSVSAAIIAGPDAEETLHWMLRSIQEVVDEVVIADCGMSEEARRIAVQYGTRLVPGMDPKAEGFERARNLALDACSCEWCLWIDTDERLVGGEALERYLRENSCQGYGIRQHHFACDVVVPPDVPVRLFRRRPYKGRALRFHGAIHEHPELAVNEGPGPTVALGDVAIAHVGYLAESVRRTRFARNLPLLALDQQRYPNRLLQKYYIMRDTMHLVRYALERTGGNVDNAIRGKCREIIRLYRTHFLPLKGRAAPDALQYYSEALEVLGEGFEAAFQVEADKTRAQPNGVRRYRFASTEDLAAELQRTVNEKAQHFDSHWW